MLITLGLEGQPAADVLPATVMTWVGTITRNRDFTRDGDNVRIREAFRVLAERSRRWPAPADFLDALPRPMSAHKDMKRLPSEQSLQTGQNHIATISKKLGISPAPEAPKPAPDPVKGYEMRRRDPDTGKFGAWRHLDESMFVHFSKLDTIYEIREIGVSA